MKNINWKIVAISWGIILVASVILGLLIWDKTSMQLSTIIALAFGGYYAYAKSTTNKWLHVLASILGYYLLSLILLLIALVIISLLR